MRRPIIAVLLALLVVLAGCGNGGDDEPTNDVTIKNADELRNTIQPDTEATVRAKVEGDDIDIVRLKWRVYDRSGSVIATDAKRIFDSDGDGTHEGTIPGQDPGYRVKYKVVASYTDTSTNQTDPGSYNVSNIKSISGPPSQTTNDTSEITVTVYEYSGVESVTVRYTRVPESGGTETTSEVTRESVSSRTVNVPIDNEVGSDTNKTISYQVIVSHGESQSYSSKEDSYSYVDDDVADFLYVPVKFSSSQSATPISELDKRATKVDQYFYTQSAGHVTFTHRVYGGYVVLSENKSAYIEDGSYKRNKIRFETRDLLKERGVNYSAYDRIFYVVEETAYQGEQIILRSGAWNKESITSTNGKRNPYGDWAHELGHSKFGWDDYYTEKYGRTYVWGVMGAGGENSPLKNRPPQVAIHNRLREGWTSERKVSHEALPRGTPYEVTLEDLHEQGGALNYTISGSAENSLFDYYLIAARDQRDVDNVPKQMNEIDGVEYPKKGDGEGIVIYGVTTQDNKARTINYVLNPGVKRDNYTRAVTLRENADDVVRDPDVGVQIEAKSAEEGKATVTLTNKTYTNLQGVNVYVLLKDCEKARDTTDQGDCSAVNATEPGDNVTTVYGSLRAETKNGTIGYTSDGGFVDNVTGSYFVSAGLVEKVFVPSNTSATFVVDVPNVTASNLTLVTQTVSRDENGTRTASEFRRQNVSANETVRPELARLNVTRDRWDAGSLRTLESTSLNLSVENNGIRNLTNVTVSTNATWVQVNRSTLGTVRDDGTVPLSVTTSVPGGQPVGNYTIAVTVTANGTRTVQRETMLVHVTVLPTVYWQATPDTASRELSAANVTRVNVTVHNSEASNVPLRDVETTVAGNVTRYNVTAPRFIDTVQPGETVTLTTVVEVPDSGIEEGTYNGTFTVDVLDEYGRYFEYPVPVDEDYVVPNRTEEQTAVSVTAHGPSVNSTATFHPEKQVAMRKGATTERVTVKPVTDDRQVPTDSVTVEATIPDGWTLQSPNGQPVRDKDVTVWIVANATANTTAGHGGQRYKLDADHYIVTVVNESVVVSIPDVDATAFGRHLSVGDVLEFEYKLNKQSKAATYGYNSAVRVQTTSPQAIYRTERPVAAVDLIRARDGQPPGRAGGHPSRVPETAVRASAGIGENATLSNPTQVAVDIDGEQTQWLRFRLSGAGQPTRHLWVRLNDDTAINATLTGDGYARVEGVITPPREVVFASDLQRGREVTVQFPMTANATRTLAFVDLSVDAANDTAVLVAADGSRTEKIRVTNASTTGSVEIPVVVGEQVFNASAESEETDDG